MIIKNIKQLENSFKEYLIELYIFLVWLFHISLIAYLTLAYIWKDVFSIIRFDFFESYIVDFFPADFGAWLVVLFLFILSAVYLRKDRNRMGKNCVWDGTKAEAVIYILASFCFGHFFARTIFVIVPFLWIKTLLLTIFFANILPDCVVFLSQPQFIFFKESFKKQQIAFTKMDIKREDFTDIKSLMKLTTQFSVNLVKSISREENTKKLLVAIKGFVLIGGFIGGIWLCLFTYQQYQRNLRENLTIVKVKPTITTMGEKIHMSGYNFGWRDGEQDLLITNQGEIPLVDRWNDTELDFTIPLYFHEGPTQIWVERTIKDQDIERIKISNIVNLDIKSRWYFYPTVEDLQPDKYHYNLLIRIIQKIKRTIFLGHG